jgi:transcriptional regulator GlxA family with amidase domain
MLNVLILIYDGIYLLDFCGPLEVFHDAMTQDNKPAFNTALIAKSLNPIKCHTGTVVTPNYSIDNCPVPDILVIPGGNLNFIQENKILGAWIKSVSLKTKFILSVCTGAFILAELGLLDGLNATTWFGAVKNLKEEYPKINVLSNKRVVDNGKIITTAGVSAGIDGALHVISKAYSIEIAKKTAEFIEYIWHID